MKKLLNDWKGYLMSGISYMLPVVIGGSLVVAVPTIIALCFGVTNLGSYKTGIWHLMNEIAQIGWTGIGLVNLVLAGYIAYAIGDKPGLAAALSVVLLRQIPIWASWELWLPDSLLVIQHAGAKTIFMLVKNSKQLCL